MRVIDDIIYVVLWYLGLRIVWDSNSGAVRFESLGI